MHMMDSELTKSRAGTKRPDCDEVGGDRHLKYRVARFSLLWSPGAPITLTGTHLHPALPLGYILVVLMTRLGDVFAAQHPQGDTPG